MADIRINSLPTTASASSSDDFLALDGATNGTRKLDAYSPTFGGNLTVSGTATLGPTNPFKFDTNVMQSTASGFNGALVRSAVSTVGNPTFSNVDDTDTGIYFPAANTLAITTGGTQRLSVDATATTLAGNLTVSGTGNSTFAGNVVSKNTAILFGDGADNSASLYATGGPVKFWANATEAARIFANGTLFIGASPVDSSNGKLQLATHTTSAGGIGFGTDTSLYRSAAGQLRGPSSFIDATFASSGLFFGASMTLQANDNVLIKTNGSVTALTLDSSQNATFAGSVKAASEVYAEKSGAGIAGQSVGLITQVTTVNSTTYNVTTGSAKVFVVQLSSGDAALCYASYKSSTITILGSDGTIVNSSSPTSTQLGIYKSANDHVISFKTGSNALAGSYGSWGFCFLGNPVISIA